MHSPQARVTGLLVFLKPPADQELGQLLRCGSNLCRGAKPFFSIAHKRIQTSAYELCTCAAKCNSLIPYTLQE